MLVGVVTSASAVGWRPIAASALVAAAAAIAPATSTKPALQSHGGLTVIASFTIVAYSTPPVSCAPGGTCNVPLTRRRPETFPLTNASVPTSTFWSDNIAGPPTRSEPADRSCVDVRMPPGPATWSAPPARTSAFATRSPPMPIAAPVSSNTGVVRESNESVRMRAGALTLSHEQSAKRWPRVASAAAQAAPVAVGSWIGSPRPLQSGLVTPVSPATLAIRRAAAAG